MTGVREGSVLDVGPHPFFEWAWLLWVGLLAVTVALPAGMQNTVLVGAFLANLVLSVLQMRITARIDHRGVTATSLRTHSIDWDGVARVERREVRGRVAAWTFHSVNGRRVRVGIGPRPRIDRRPALDRDVRQLVEGYITARVRTPSVSKGTISGRL